MGAEGCGIVAATGPGVTSLRPGDAAICPTAQYNEYAVLPQTSVIKVPEATPQVVAMTLSGTFGYIVVHHAATIQPGQALFVTAGAGVAPPHPPPQRSGGSVPHTHWSLHSTAPFAYAAAACMLQNRPAPQALPAPPGALHARGSSRREEQHHCDRSPGKA